MHVRRMKLGSYEGKVHRTFVKVEPVQDIAFEDDAPETTRHEKLSFHNFLEQTGKKLDFFFDLRGSTVAYQRSSCFSHSTSRPKAKQTESTR
mmetsp:Transcript_6857/g.14100  ORF Transcript_6857/g.14100 Transcript_6857/m.14100 type:complete len:92 (+) Transcript_6857:753-1028(+)